MGVDPVEVREDLRACAKKLLFSKVKGIKKVPNISGLNVGVEGFEPPTLPIASGCSEPAELNFSLNQLH